MQAAEQAVGEVAESFGVSVAGGATAVVVRSGARGRAERGEGPHVAGSGEALILDPPRDTTVLGPLARVTGALPA